jgi:arabinose-5-phosphate isomerase
MDDSRKSSDIDIVKIGKQVIKIESHAVANLESRIGENFRKAVEILLNCEGRVIVSGMGKSGIIAQKIASTLTSTGTAALFLHPAEGVHGDLGAVMKEDVVICISKSGNTEEILRLLPMFRRQGVPILAMTGNMDSPLARRSDTALDVSIKEEACPYDLVPTASTTVTLVMGDALAMALFQKRGFSVEDFVQFHPGGDIGKRLLLRVDDIMRTGEDMARVQEDTPLTDTILEITSKRLGATCIMTKSGKLAGIITDGDIRRLMERKHDIWKLRAKDIMSRHPKCIESGSLAARALHLMEEYSINQLVIVDKKMNPAGMVHVHDILKAGIA